MKKQYLTSTQKEVLLEMCRVMFPESEKIIWYSDQNMEEDMFPEVIDNSEECEEFILFNAYPTIKEKAVTIHWFELCITELGKRILNNSRLISNMVEGHVFNDIHMVDYLYKEFKER